MFCDDSVDLSIVSYSLGHIDVTISSSINEKLPFVTLLHFMEIHVTQFRSESWLYYSNGFAKTAIYSLDLCW